MRVSNRLAKDKLRMFEALAAYANMGDHPEDWKKFHLMYPDFFPVKSGFNREGFENLTTWMYWFAEEWHKDLSAFPVVPPLLWYRNRLRSVWARTDQSGYALAVLLGFEKEAVKIASEYPGEIAFETIARPSLVPGQQARKEESHGLPPGRPLINGVTGSVTWEFGCNIQQAVYELMLERWRTKICPMCGKFFVAMKTAQKLCSARCSGDAKRQRALNYWNQTGKKLRSAAQKESR